MCNLDTEAGQFGTLYRDSPKPSSESWLSMIRWLSIRRYVGATARKSVVVAVREDRKTRGAYGITDRDYVDLRKER